MSLPFRRRSRPRGQARLALTGDFNEDGYTVTEMLIAAGPSDWNGTAIEFTGASVIGLPEGVTAFAVKQQDRDTEPLARYQPAPGSQPPPITGRVLDTLNYLRLKVAILEAAGDADRIDASEQARRDGQQLLAWSPLRQIFDDAAALLRRGAS